MDKHINDQKNEYLKLLHDRNKEIDQIEEILKRKKELGIKLSK